MKNLVDRLEVVHQLHEGGVAVDIPGVQPEILPVRDSIAGGDHHDAFESVNVGNLRRRREAGTARADRLENGHRDRVLHASDLVLGRHPRHDFVFTFRGNADARPPEGGRDSNSGALVLEPPDAGFGVLPDWGKRMVNRGRLAVSENDACDLRHRFLSGS